MKDPIDDRREHFRINLAAEEYDYPCRIRYGEHEYRARLLDVSTGGARLLVYGGGADLGGAGRGMYLHATMNEPGHLQNIPYHTRWYRGNEMGVEFEPPLNADREELRRSMVNCR
ncbi:PilZ domain-containing protein [Nitratidesulfovibrio sp. SRB-5]|uniref:PilZ domain-containing protein n=1 Tax=Nitratidesulfovibrio sp. SRB-5 TaxID=2872636 RepID=UPI0010274B51|nr:PilZ domain-containing protein [Nitratidesulfovibrio sp. SRB-5]MBZ2171951.1 PilZ domain-containing protein [Nitratidesulfovibrio sp. SRB-5]RXF78567.1 PilZ domain-containing protein [Desulfovibrio sp. DS-1]